jgi:hypothetical protein
MQYFFAILTSFKQKQIKQLFQKKVTIHSKRNPFVFYQVYICNFQRIFVFFAHLIHHPDVKCMISR